MQHKLRVKVATNVGDDITNTIIRGGAAKNLVSLNETSEKHICGTLNCYICRNTIRSNISRTFASGLPKFKKKMFIFLFNKLLAKRENAVLKIQKILF